MHSKKDTFSSFFTNLQFLNPGDIAKLFKVKPSSRKADISFLMKFFDEKFLDIENCTSYLVIHDLKSDQLLYVSSSVYNVTGYKKEEFISGGTSLLLKNICPTDRENCLKILVKISSHQKESISDKHLYQYQTTFRFLNKNGYYKWILYKMMFVAHDEKNIPWISISIITNMDNFTINDDLCFSQLKFNPKTAIYDIEYNEVYKPEYLNILNQKDLIILKLLAEGMDNKQIANELNHKENTIKDYRKKMLKKTWCENSAELLAFALRNGLIN